MAVVAVVLGCLFASSVANELKVSQYDGPTECAPTDKVKPGDKLGMHCAYLLSEPIRLSRCFRRLIALV